VVSPHGPSGSAHWALPLVQGTCRPVIRDSGSAGAAGGGTDLAGSPEQLGPASRAAEGMSVSPASNAGPAPPRSAVTLDRTAGRQGGSSRR
jgi:hypothetical protein